MINLSAEKEDIIYKARRKVTGYTCDICHKSFEFENKKVLKFFEVTTGHNDWGNDSCDSVIHRDICPSCIEKFVSKYVSEANRTDYLEVQTSHVWKGQDVYE